MKIISFGSLNIDHTYSLEHICEVGETITAKTLEFFPGGKGFNQAVALGRAGAEAYMVGQIGSDGVFMVDFLNENGINTEFVRMTDYVNGHALIQVDEQGRNCIIVYGGANREQEEDYIVSTLQHFSVGDVLVLQNEINKLDFIIRTAKNRGMTIALNPSPVDDNIKSIDFSLVDYLFINEVEALALSGKSVPKEVFEYFSKLYPKCNIIMTLGELGATAMVAGEFCHCPAEQVKVVDTTAAGDTFMGYFLVNIMEGQPLAQSMKIASKASALAISNKGAAVSIPFRVDVVE